LGLYDISDRFDIPQKIYGRKEEVENLLQAFDRVADRQHPSKIEMMLVAGYSGIGKSCLVAEIHKPNTRLNGYFTEGKFDQFQRNIPYSAIVNALKGLIGQLLTESQENLNQWREKLLAAVGENGQVIIDVIPEVELIIGKQQPVLELPPTESQNRFNRVFSQFIRAFCTQEHCLVIFLDDLQWADSATLKLIKLMMMDDESQYLFLIGAYRDNEVSPTHPLMMMVEELKKKQVIINTITLAPLNLDSISQLMADTLSSQTEEVKPLAELVQQKTGGNPFFVNQFLKNLHSENLITFHRPELTDKNQDVFWEWNLNKIKAKNITDNVVELMIGKLKKLPESTQKVLRLAACIGASFNLTTIAIICEKSRAEVFPNLIIAIQSGLILPSSDLDNELLIEEYKFLHDRIQQAAYALIDEGQKKSVHLQIGRLLLQNTRPETLLENIFEIIDQLNLGIDLITSCSEKETIAKLNLKAGQKAKSATAYTAAINYFKTGIKLLNKDSWESQYNLTLNLHTEAVEAAYLNGNFEEMEKLALVVQTNAKTILDQVKVYDSQIQAIASQGDLKRAIKVSLQVIEQLGVFLPENPSQVDIQRVLEETASLYDEEEIEGLIDRPQMTNPKMKAAVYLMSGLSPIAYAAVPTLMVFLVISEAKIAIQYGNDIRAIFGYVSYGALLCALFDNIESGYKFGNLALNLLERFNAKRSKAEVLNVFCGHVMFWKKHIKETLPILSEGHQNGVEIGDFAFASSCAFYRCNHAYFMGEPLSEVEQTTAVYSHSIRQLRRENYLNWNLIVWQTILNLLGQSQDPCQLIGDAYNEETALPYAIAVNDRTQIHLLYLHKLILFYLFGDYEQALENAAMAEQYLDGVIAQLVIPIFYFYDSLILLSLFVDASNSQQEAWLDRINSNQAKIRNWADHAPMNFLHKFHLVEAEKARVLNQVLAAEEFYEQAILGAKENEFIQEEALAYELAAKFYLERNRVKFAQVYMQEAHYAYARWGAQAKVESLAAKYPQFLSKSSSTKSINTTQTNSNPIINAGEILDLATVMKASQAISGEIMLDKLLSKLMTILIENAGAQTGFLIFNKAGEWVIEACGDLDSDNIPVLQSSPIDDRLPKSIINYVTHTKEIVVEKDAVKLGQFINDPYIKANQTKSILSAPLINQGNLSGIVYLENNLTTGAFTPERLAIIQLLSGEAAIAIDNARLYNNLEQKVAERTQELTKTLEELKNTQDELIQKEKMAALGQLIAGIAHEINTPLGAIRSSAGNMAKFLEQTLDQLPTLFQSLSIEESAIFLTLLQRSLQNKFSFSTKEERKLKRALRRELENYQIDDADLIAERLAIMGIFDNLDAFVSLLKRPDNFPILEIAYKLSELQRCTATINASTDRASKVVFALKTYARYNLSGEKTIAHLSDGIETILTLYENQLKHGVELIKNYADIHPILCYPDELNQVWTNLIHNSLQAMNNKGTLTIDITEVERDVKISITDTGCGIPADIKDKIFQPFFTTKPPGEGSGLGLDIVKKIIDKHSGKITVDSQPGQTTFNIFIPLESDD
jgi:predicted ATPase/signal transduction histidine kinase